MTDAAGGCKNAFISGKCRSAYTRRFTEQMKRRCTPITLTERIRENNAEKVRTGE